ncbi:Retrovirus-related Pol polyprotein from transposon 297 [Araneus ventricosus]|uniref:Retrovirus-related Pol polyprotein from transposon 297 n=1 Tax=Araneus ventricosus TaxID=182803 RepID=A0A4Y2E7N5_ARAVE|nr:Retrovirus-related Pol polyprotein from transposon 297 [Araneus ventricosus]
MNESLPDNVSPIPQIPIIIRPSRLTVDRQIRYTSYKLRGPSGNVRAWGLCDPGSKLYSTEDPLCMWATLERECSRHLTAVETYKYIVLSSAEKNYSTTEREALAVVWALDKFRRYIEGADIIVASDHQPLKWLMTLSSPTGRLARWALQIQTYNLKIDYFPDKCNVVADMLSRPECSDKQTCEACCKLLHAPERKLAMETLSSSLHTMRSGSPQMSKRPIGL